MGSENGRVPLAPGCEASPSAADGVFAESHPSRKPIPMILHCPVCALQHIDAPDERTPDWTNPPHKSHLCHGCGCIWRPADVPTEGVAAIATVGKADTWRPTDPVGQVRQMQNLIQHAWVEAAAQIAETRYAGKGWHPAAINAGIGIAEAIRKLAK